MLASGAVPGNAQFARVPQDAAGQYPSYSGSSYPGDSYSGQPAANATVPDSANDQQHGAARISVVQGDVNVRRGDTSELVAAAMNAPLMGQDRLQTSAGSRAEIELDSANLIRLAPNTDVGLAELQYGHFQVQLGAGAIFYRVLRDPESQGEIDTPSIALRALGEGAFRVAILDDGTTQIDVRAGAAEILGPRGSQRIDAGHSVLVRGNPADPEFQEIAPSAFDQFDEWSETRDRELLSSQSYQYVSRDINGAEDLDANGAWVSSQYGQVWAPRTTVADWAPYSNGQWSWEPYYGWTWVDYAPWGWAPYHYGRWFWNGGYGWCWWPGARLSAHLWSPALVGFFGWNNGSLGWCSLAPYERFQPWWGRGGFGGGYRGYGPGGLNGLRNAGVWGVYRNAAFRGGALYAGYNGFGGPRQRFGFATREQLGSANFLRGQIPVGPNRASYLFSNRQAVANSRLASVSHLQFFQSRPSSFGGAGQRVGAAGWSRGGYTVSGGNSPSNYTRSTPPNTYRSSGQSGYSVAPRSGAELGRRTVNGWQRFGDPGTGSGYRQGLTGGSGESGWHQFGRPQQSYPSAESYDRGSRPYSGSSSVPQQRGLSDYGGNGYRGGGSPYNGAAAPRFSAPSPQPRYNAPSQSHYNAPSSRGGGNAPSSHSSGGHYSSGSSGRHGR